MKSSVRLAAIGGIATLATAFLTGTSLAPPSRMPRNSRARCSCRPTP
ncbi:MAG: hypothetical protein WBF20_05605 [Trebonia sp.]